MILIPVMPMCYLMPHGGAGSPSNSNQTTPYRTQKEVPEVTAPGSKAPENGDRHNCDGDDEVYYHLLEGYDKPGTWQLVEEGLYIRCTKLPILEKCYVEKGDGGYALWGATAADLELVLQDFSYGFIRFDMKEMEMEARMIDTKQGTKALGGLKIALRELRTYPKLIGYVTFDNGHSCFLESAWKGVNKKIAKEGLEDDLVRAILRTRRTPITFW